MRDRVDDTRRFAKIGVVAALCCLVLGCTGKSPGPDKQFAGELTGAMTGAGAGAVTGFQVGAGAGPGALVGAGFGAVAGGIKGFVRDEAEEDLLQSSAEAKTERELAQVHEILQDHYKRRIELHPTRDIYPADLFFVGDRTALCPTGARLVEEIARLNYNRMPWSRLAIVVYARASQPDSTFAEHLVERRAIAIADRMAKAGLNPRRLQTRPTVVDAPILIDPLDRSDRYEQAVEFVPVDR